MLKNSLDRIKRYDTQGCEKKISKFSIFRGAGNGNRFIGKGIQNYICILKSNGPKRYKRWITTCGSESEKNSHSISVDSSGGRFRGLINPLFVFLFLAAVTFILLAGISYSISRADAVECHLLSEPQA